MLNEQSDALATVLKGEFAKTLADMLNRKIMETGTPKKILLNSGEAAWALGFTERAFLQSTWKDEIPFVKVGIKTFYRHQDLETFAANHLTQRLR